MPAADPASLPLLVSTLSLGDLSLAGLPDLAVDLAQRVPSWVWVGLSAGTLAMVVASVVGVPRLLVRLPADWLARPEPGFLAHLREDPPLRVLTRVGRNLLGLVLLVLGVLMLFVPGQGVLTVIAGVVLLDLPGRRALIRRVLGRPSVARVVQRWRRKARVDPLEGIPGAGEEGAPPEEESGG